MDQKPSVGRIVHYQSLGSANGEYPSAPRAAIITGVTIDNSNGQLIDSVSLAILNPEGMFFKQDIAYSAEPKAGCWNWPPRV